MQPVARVSLHQMCCVARRRLTCMLTLQIYLANELPVVLASADRYEANRWV